MDTPIAMKILRRAGTRVLMRYVATLLVGYGVFSASDVSLLLNDPELEQALSIGLGLALAGLAEWVWLKARRLFGDASPDDGWSV